jgi:NOL1/NOP2/fmu family ribosome biogenesis protein
MKLTLILTFASLAFIADQALAEQPKMEAALSSLKQARESLKGATADKGGYRSQAIRTIDQAIEQVKAGIEFDQAHQSKNERRKE